MWELHRIQQDEDRTSSAKIDVQLRDLLLRVVDFRTGQHDGGGVLGNVRLLQERERKEIVPVAARGSARSRPPTPLPLPPE